MSPTGHTAKFLRNAKLGRNRRTHALTCPRPDPLVNDPDRTQLHIGGVLSYVEGWAIPSQPWGDIAMKASLLFVAGLAIAISSIAPANAAPVRATGGCPGGCATSFRTGNAPWVGCSSAGGWNFSQVPCRNVFNFKSYGECQTGLIKLGNTSLERWWYCSSLGIKD